MPVPDVYVLDPNWFKKNNIRSWWATACMPDTVPPPEDAHTIAKMAHSIAALGDSYIPGKDFHEQNEWADEVHIGISWCVIPNGAPFQLGPVDTKTHRILQKRGRRGLRRLATLRARLR